MNRLVKLGSRQPCLTIDNKTFISCCKAIPTLRVAKGVILAVTSASSILAIRLALFAFFILEHSVIFSSLLKSS
ncbi:hypothetical protein PghCCS26_32290 [Paenibacillus glycanilyticus]|uniref:Uncharacterized protein n=1 Tax=Paenibacillus glycanilyticus TaxID=126569 RepID=A0ABQ6NLX3_9BACL|nr:hypothetical protein PghCCS26_32290 [Paenibacillus glycanilyticus]